MLIDTDIDGSVLKIHKKYTKNADVLLNMSWNIWRGVHMGGFTQWCSKLTHGSVLRSKGDQEKNMVLVLNQDLQMEGKYCNFYTFNSLLCFLNPF